MTIEVLGSGSWGTALAALLAQNGHAVRLLGRSAAEIEDVKTTRHNSRYLPGVELPANLEAGLLGEAAKADMHVVAVPSPAVREVCQDLAGKATLTVLASKGLEPESGRLMTQVAEDVLGKVRIGALSGPNLAVEIVHGIPTAAISAFPLEADAEIVREAFMCRSFRVYNSGDVIGVELSGALKNVLAIGAGMSDGLGFGDNTKGALLSRGLREMMRLGSAMGARADTFIGIAGVGDLFATASSNLSRNYRIGRAVGQGKDLQEALAEIGQVAEGVQTARATVNLAAKFGAPMPVFGAIHQVLTGDLPCRQAVSLLMERSTRYEGDSF